MDQCDQPQDTIAFGALILLYREIISIIPLPHMARKQRTKKYKQRYIISFMTVWMGSVGLYGGKNALRIVYFYAAPISWKDGNHHPATISCEGDTGVF